VKKKLAGLNMRIQIGGVVLGLLLVTYVAHMLVVAPQGAKASKIQTEIDATQTQIYQRQADLKAAGHPPTIKVADLFKLSRAMPDRPDMPGIILTLSQVAREAGISFDLIEPVVGAAPDAATGGYQSQRIHLLFNGDFYGLSDFLYRLRSLVVVHDGKLAAAGRLFNADTVIFNVEQDSFPKISAELYVNAYVYEPAAATPATGTTPADPSAPATTTTDSTTTTPADAGAAPPAGATAAGATP
jgi:Tfp pilus assembly protein PilO